MKAVILYAFDINDVEYPEEKVLAFGSDAEMDSLAASLSARLEAVGAVGGVGPLDSNQLRAKTVYISGPAVVPGDDLDPVGDVYKKHVVNPG